MTALEHEARTVLAIFTDAKDGDQVMDGDGLIWTYGRNAWRHKRRAIDPVALAKALNPDLAHLWTVHELIKYVAPYGDAGARKPGMAVCSCTAFLEDAGLTKAGAARWMKDHPNRQHRGARGEEPQR